MDLASISTAVSALKAAKDIGQAAVAFRDFNQAAGAIAQINEQLLKAQDSLFTHNAQLMELQQQHFEAREELRKLKEALAEKARYTLFEISPGEFVYRSDVVPQQGGSGEPGAAQPLHYLCQTCFDKGSKSVLQKPGDRLYCPLCKTAYGPRGTSLTFSPEWPDRGF